MAKIQAAFRINGINLDSLRSQNSSLLGLQTPLTEYRDCFPEHTVILVWLKLRKMSDTSLSQVWEDTYNVACVLQDNCSIYIHWVINRLTKHISCSNEEKIGLLCRIYCFCITCNSINNSFGAWRGQKVLYLS